MDDKIPCGEPDPDVVARSLLDFKEGRWQTLEEVIEELCNEEKYE